LLAVIFSFQSVHLQLISIFFVLVLARDKMGLPMDVPVKVVLEQDGTEIDDDEYFNTMERNTTLMILINDQKWLPPGKLPRLE